MDTGYSHKQRAEDTIKLKVERAINMVQGDNPNPDVAIQHPEWVRAAQQKNYTELTKYVTEHTKKLQLRARERREKTHGQNKDN